MLDMSSSKAALEKFRIISPFFHDELPLARIAADQGISERTLRRWVVLYRKNSLKGLERKVRTDKGRRRKISLDMEEIVTGCTLQKPPISIKTIHQKITDIADQNQVSAPSYSVVYDIASKIDPALLMLAHEGSKTYSERYDLVYRRRHPPPMKCGRRTILCWISSS